MRATSKLIRTDSTTVKPKALKYWPAIPGISFVEVTPAGKGYLILDQARGGPFDTVQQQRVPEGHYWVLGDNRDNSVDSRAMFQVGFVPARNIYRKVAFIYWSRDRSRIGMAVE